MEKLPSDIALKIDGRYILASGQDRRNLLMQKVAEPYLKDLSFDRDTGLASSYIAWSRGGKKIVMNPHRRFGEPIVESCGYAASTLWEACEIEGSVQAAAEVYGVENTEVELACKYHNFLLKNAV